MDGDKILGEDGSGDDPLRPIPVNSLIIIDDVIPMSSASSISTPELPNVKVKALGLAKNSGSSPQSSRSAGSISSFSSPKSARGFIDTTAPFESVKEAVSKFGGIVDWKAHRAQTVERRKQVEQELEKIHEEIPYMRNKSESAELEKTKILQELDNTKRHIEELKLNLERAQTEEQQAKQDSELAKLRVEEMEQGIADDASVAAKAQLEVAKARHSTAVSELDSVNNELTSIRKEHELLLIEKEEVRKRADQAVAASREIEKTVEDLTIELISSKEALESAHAAHLEAEEQRIGVAMAREQDYLQWEKELKQADDEVNKLNQQIIYAKELKSKYEIASSLLNNLKTELASYMITNPETNLHVAIHEAVTSAKRELEEVSSKIEKTTSEVTALKSSVKEIETELEKEKASLSTMKQREGMASVAVSAIEGELERTLEEIADTRGKEKEAKRQLNELPKQVKEAAELAEEAKSGAAAAQEEFRRAREELEQAKAGESTTESRLTAAQKEIEAARASEKLAQAAMRALQESEKTEEGVTLSLEEYYELSKKAHEAEEEANARIAVSLAQVREAKEAEARTLKKLEQVTVEMQNRKEILKEAMEKAEKAKEGKLGVEQELRKWRADHESRRKAAQYNHSPNHAMAPPDPLPNPNPRLLKKKKKSLFPRFFMFLARKKAPASNS